MGGSTVGSVDDNMKAGRIAQLDMAKKCPACDGLYLHHDRPTNGYSYYVCNSCGWKSTQAAMRIYVRATLGAKRADPGVLYLMELFQVGKDPWSDWRNDMAPASGKIK